MNDEMLRLRRRDGSPAQDGDLIIYHEGREVAEPAPKVVAEALREAGDDMVDAIATAFDLMGRESMPRIVRDAIKDWFDVRGKDRPR